MSPLSWLDMRVFGAGSDYRQTVRAALSVKKFQSVGPVRRGVHFPAPGPRRVMSLNRGRQERLSFFSHFVSGAAMASSTIDNRSVRSCTTFL